MNGEIGADELRRKHMTAALELVLAGALWGFGFIAAVWTLRGMGPLAASGWRFLAAAAIGFVVIFITNRRELWNREQFLLAMVPGLFLSATITLQTWGLKYTTATKSGFITTLYVLIVPLLETVVLKKRLPRMHFVYVVLGLIGVALICDLPRTIFGAATSEAIDEKSAWNIGDLMTFACAIGASVQILWFGLIQTRIRSALAFNNYQAFWTGLLPATLSLLWEPAPQLSTANLSWQGFVILIAGPSLIAFTLQVRAQKFLSPSIASLLFLLESPFGALFAMFFLGESLRGPQWLGAGLIVASAALSTAFINEARDSGDQTA